MKDILDLHIASLEENPYYKDNPEYFNELIQLILKNVYVRQLKCIGAQGHSKDRRYLLKWVFDKTNMLDDEYTIPTRCFWIIHGYTDFPKCWNFEECHNTLKHQNINTIYNGYRTCSCSKACREKYRVMKTRQTLLNTYGVVNVFQLESVKDKCKNTHIINLGVENPSQSIYIKQKKIETCIKNYGVEHPLQSAELFEKFQHTCQERYGDINPAYCPELVQRAIESNLKKYGVPCPFQAESVKDTIKKTIKERYGVDYALQSKDIREKSKETCRKKYGTDFCIQNAEFRRRVQKRYIYNNIHFDSKPEIAFYIWLKDNDADFEYQPDARFEYEFEGKVRKYFPDFRVNDVYYEIKGGHMVSEDGDWICPWDRSQDDRYRAKQKCAAQNGVVVLTETDYRKYVDYVKEKYGMKWLDGFKAGH